MNFSEENIETQEYDITIFNLVEDESIFVEVNEKGEFLCDFEEEIDLRQPIQIEDLKIIQGEKEIFLPDEEVLNYFLQIQEEIKNENRESE